MTVLAITPIPQLVDNYAWLISDPASGACAVVDPADARSVEAEVFERGLSLDWILATHHHIDHVGGISGLVSVFGIEVVGSGVEQELSRIPEQTRGLAHGERLEVAGHEMECLFVPGHTSGSVAYHFPAAGVVFTGDTLFLAGCGRLFEGDARQMYASLRKLRALPPATLIYCGHEYTENNLRFAQSLLPGDPGIDARLRAVVAARERNDPTVPATLEVELATNPFLRSEDRTLGAALGFSDPQEVFAETRRRRDQW